MVNNLNMILQPFPLASFEPDVMTYCSYFVRATDFDFSPPVVKVLMPALPIDVLQQEWWVPGNTSRAECAKFQCKDQFREILAPSIETTKLWVQRATQDHM